MKRKITALCVVIAMLAVAIIGGTMAYFTDTDEAVNVMVIGNVKIKQNEQDRTGAEFEQNQMMLPIVTGAHIKDADGYPACENYVDKIVTVTNTGKSDAYVRTLIAIPKFTYEGEVANNASLNVLHWNGYSYGDTSDKYPAATRIPGTTTDVVNNWYWGTNENGAWPGNGGDWNTVEITVNDITYTVYAVTNNAIVKPGETTAPNMTGLYLDSKVDFDGTNYTINGKAIKGLEENFGVLVISQGVQAAGFADAFAAFDAAFPFNAANATEWFADLYIGGEAVFNDGTDNALTAYQDADGNYELTSNVNLYDTTIVRNYQSTGAYTFEGNGNTVNMVASDDQTFDWIGGNIPKMALIFSSEDGSAVTVNDVTITGTMQSVMAGNYVNSSSNWFNTTFNNVKIVDAKVVSLSAGISPALTVYGKLAMNDCTVYGSTLSELDTDPMWPVYDMALVNYSTTTINNSKIGSIYVWNQAELHVQKDTTVDSIVIRGNMNTSKYGIYVEAGATVGVIDLSNIVDKKRVNITVDAGATVGKYVANGVEYASIAAWQAAQ